MSLTPITMQYVVDQANNNNFFTINTVQGDGHEARYAEFSLTNNGYPYEIPEGAHVIIKGTKSDGTGIENDCEVIDTDMIRFEITAQMSAAVGIGIYNISILTEEEEPTVLSSFPFYINVTSDSQSPDTVISSDEYQGQVNLMADFAEEQQAQISEVNHLIDQMVLYDVIGTFGTSISRQPEDATYEAGSVATFSIAVSGPVSSYQWQYSNDNGTTWEDMSTTTYPSAATDTLVFDVPASGSGSGGRYRCKVTDPNNVEMVSTSAIITVYRAIITTQPTDVTASAGDNVSFSIVAEGTPVSYQWQYSTDNGASWLNLMARSCPSCVTPTLTFVAQTNHNGNQYRCKVTWQSSTVVYSNAATLTVTA